MVELFTIQDVSHKASDSMFCWGCKCTGIMRKKKTFWGIKESGQIIATSHDLTPNGGLVRGIPLFQGNLGW